MSTSSSRVTLSRAERKICRIVAGESWNARAVKVVEGNSPPTIVGEGSYHVTPAGDICRYPSAYRRKFGRPIYVHSTKRVDVGEQWILEQRNYQCWPQNATQTLTEFRMGLERWHNNRRKVDVLAEELCGYRYGSWRRDNAKRKQVADAIREHRTGI